MRSKKHSDYIQAQVMASLLAERKGVRSWADYVLCGAAGLFVQGLNGVKLWHYFQAEIV